MLTLDYRRTELNVVYTITLSKIIKIITLYLLLLCRLILIAEKSTVYRKFPTPLINRLEKHFVLSETVLLEWQVKVLERLIDWVDKFSKINDDSK